MKNAVLFAIQSKINPLSKYTNTSRKSGVLSEKSGVRVYKLSGSTDMWKILNSKIILGDEK